MLQLYRMINEKVLKPLKYSLCEYLSKYEYDRAELKIFQMLSDRSLLARPDVLLTILFEVYIEVIN